MLPTLSALEADAIGAQGLEACAVEWLGSTLDLDEAAFSDRVALAKGSRPGQTRDAWLRLLARETLLRGFLASGSVSAPPALASISPFPRSKANLGDLAGRRGAVGVFPLDRRAGLGLAAALFLVERRGEDTWDEDRDLLEGASVRAREPWHLFVAVEGDGERNHDARHLSGDSWQLAYALARRAAERRSVQAVRALAMTWAVSGAVEGESIREVVVGNKLDAPGLRRRRFLFPEENRAALSQRFLEKPESDSRAAARVRFAADLGQAWSRVVAGDPVHRGAESLPAGIPVLHSFVSAAWPVVVAAVVLLRPKRLVLWVSDDKGFIKAAKALAQAFRSPQLGWLRCEVEEPFRKVSSKNLAEAHSQIARELRQDLSLGPVWFNVTLGNRLMSYAVLPFAQLDDGLTLLYRDIDAKACAFTTLSYDGVSPVTTIRRGSLPRKLPKTAKEVLFGKPRGPQPPPTASLILERLGYPTGDGAPSGPEKKSGCLSGKPASAALPVS